MLVPPDKIVHHLWHYTPCYPLAPKKHRNTSICFHAECYSSTLWYFPHVLIQYPGDKTSRTSICLQTFNLQKKTLPHKSSEKLSNSTGSFGTNEVLVKWVSMETNMLTAEDRAALWYERSRLWGTKITSSHQETQCQRSLSQRAQPVINGDIYLLHTAPSNGK